MGEYCKVVCRNITVAGPMPCKDFYGRILDKDCKINIFDLEFIKPMPWIGLYAAVASLICTMGMAADTIHGFRSKKFWFPCKFFGLNAATLTLLAAGTKLSVDLSTKMQGPEDQLAKLSSTIFLSIAMGNFIPSLGSMDNQSILMNVTALVIFVFTVIANMSIQICNNLYNYYLFNEFILATVGMLVLLILLVSSALSVPTTKKYIETKYQEKYPIDSKNQHDERRKFTTEYLKDVVRKYWVTAATGNPQFVVARSATCITSGAICLLIALSLVEEFIRVHVINFSFLPLISSDYQWSTLCILAVQSIGIAVGSIAPIWRWFTAVNFKCSEEGIKSYKNELKIESYWTQSLKDGQKSSLSFSIRGNKFRKLVHNTRYACLSLCIKVQNVVVLASKCVVLFSICLLNFLFSCIRKTKVESEFESPASTDQTGEESEPGQELNSHVLLLEGEVGLPRRTLKKILDEADQLFSTGENEQPESLIKLLEKSGSYNGVTDFDSDQVPSLHSEKPPNCWSLPAATLASIAAVIPNIQKKRADGYGLRESVNEGLLYAIPIDKSQKPGEDFVKLSDAANVVWERAKLHKLLDEDRGSFKGKTSREILEWIAKKAESSITDFKKNKNGMLVKNPINWPPKFIAANSMYRISRTLLLAYEGDKDLTDEVLFDKLSVMIADIFAACFINLPHLIIMKCGCDGTEKWEESVGQAARLVGQSEKIREFLQHHDVSCNIPDQAADVDEWRALLRETSLRFTEKLKLTARHLWRR